MTETTKATPNQMPLYVMHSEAMHAANRFVLSGKGKTYVVRFSLAQRLEHLFLVIAVTVLAVTGLAQSYYNSIIGSFILNQLGGIHSARQIHHIFAVILFVQAIYHVGAFITDFYNYFTGYKIWFKRNDLSQFVQMLKYDLGFSKSRPQFDRFNFEQKIHYWTFVLGIVILGTSGLIQWFPVFTTKYLPGWVIPIAHAIHHWQAQLTVFVLLSWHLYHNIFKTVNRSIFSGVLSMEEMERDHPLELIELQRSLGALKDQKWMAPIDLHAQKDQEVPVSEPERDSTQQAAAEAGSDSNVKETVAVEAVGQEQAPSTEATDGLVMSEGGDE